jgi:hypothetical protein
MNTKNKKIEQSQQNYEKNKVRLCIQHQCECGGYFTIKNKTKHLKTAKHKNFIALTSQVNQ